ncbi:hypothetical protein GJ633_11025 [Halorubrum sp. CBA1125]|uniref:hypothetical protein n=1 Tax=Halorubrum sp. CBA1125 TaxID=2668072 RepID=UPI0012E95415|nr:hypothetical protein [Halorubrum sp. CBA1125]MUW15127.1 hypothetical protein [Halorubrum sp. CBA1125]
MIVRALLAAFGVIELLFPKRLVDAVMDLATTENSEIEFRPWVYTVARFEGVAIVVLALWCGRCGSDEDDE